MLINGSNFNTKRKKRNFNLIFGYTYCNSDKETVVRYVKYSVKSYNPICNHLLNTTSERTETKGNIK